MFSYLKMAEKLLPTFSFSFDSVLDLDNVVKVDELIEDNISSCKSEYLSLEDTRNFLKNNNMPYNLLHINCRSLPKNFDSVNALVYSLHEPFVAIGITETWLKPHHDIDLCKLPGYVFIYNNLESKAAGGVGMFIREQETYTVLPDFTVVSDIIECLFVDIFIEGKKDLIIGCVYRPPSSDINAFIDKLHELLKKCDPRKNKNIFIMGDFNINLLVSDTHVPTSNFLNSMLSHNLLPVISKPSRITDTSVSLIDNIFTNVNHSNCKSALIYDDISYHFPILLQFCGETFLSFKTQSDPLTSSQ